MMGLLPDGNFPKHVPEPEPLLDGQHALDAKADADNAVMWPPFLIVPHIERFFRSFIRLVPEGKKRAVFFYRDADGKHFRVSVEEVR